MAKSNNNNKYQFTTAAKDLKIILQQNGTTKVVTADSLTDADAEYILGSERLNKAYGHNIRENASFKPEVDPDDEELERARAEFEEVTGEKAGNRKLETLITAIEKKKAETAAE